MQRRQFEAYVDKVFGLSARVAAMPEGRQSPRHPWKKVWDAVFLGAVMQISNLHRLEAECRQGILAARLGALSEDTMGYALERQAPTAVFALGCEVARRLKRNGLLRAEGARGRIVVSSLNIDGVTFNAAGLGLTVVPGGGFQSSATIATTETAINTAISTVRAQTETFGTNSSTIQTRQSFEQNLINTLQTGASNLVLADQNQESANLLTLLTQQQLEVSALSIANQANQSVLKLFP